MKSLIPWRRREMGLLSDFRQEIDDLMMRMFGERPVAAEFESAAGWTPRVDVEETEKQIIVKADIPGVDPKDVNITVQEGVLTLRGEKKEEREEKKQNFHRVERFVGEFYRELPLPPGADQEKIVATTAKGVITITIPKKPEVQPKKIAVKAVE